MQSLKNFLNPKRKENIKFVLSDAFVDEQGNPLEWEMRQISAKEGIEVSEETADMGELDTMVTYIARALVVPNLKDRELVEAFARENNGKLLKPAEILKEIVTDGELCRLISIYNQHNKAGSDFGKLVEEAKN